MYRRLGFTISQFVENARAEQLRPDTKRTAS